MTTQLRSLADQMLSALAYVLGVSTGEFRVETGDHWVTAEVGDVSLSAFLDDEGMVTAYEASHVDSDEEPVRVEAGAPVVGLVPLRVVGLIDEVLGQRVDPLHGPRVAGHLVVEELSHLPHRPGRVLSRRSPAHRRLLLVFRIRPAAASTSSLLTPSSRASEISLALWRRAHLSSSVSRATLARTITLK